MYVLVVQHLLFCVRLTVLEERGLLLSQYTQTDPVAVQVHVFRAEPDTLPQMSLCRGV